jgi:hypothetical protein
MNYYAKHANALAGTGNRLADSCPLVNWDSGDRRVIPGTLQRRKDLVSGGFELNSDLRFEMLLSDWGYSDGNEFRKDALQTPLTYDGDTFKVQDVGIRPGGFHVVVDCNYIGQNA